MDEMERRAGLGVIAKGTRSGLSSRDFKQRGRGRRRGPQALRENPNNHLRMTGGKKFDVLRSAPT